MVINIIRHLGTGAAGSVLLFACAQLEPLRLDGRCGNRIVEPLVDEDCDSASPFGGDTQCGEAGSIGACRFICEPLASEAQCPSAYQCGVDGICRVSAGTFAEATSIELALSNPELTELADIDGDRRNDLIIIDANQVQVRFGETAGLGEVARRSVGVLTGRATVANLDDRPGLDLALPVDSGLLVVGGGSTRDLLPISYPLATTTIAPDASRLITIQAGDPLGRGRFVLLELQQESVRLDGVGSIVTPGQAIPLAGERLARYLPAANVDQDANDELILATESSTEVLVTEARCTERADGVSCTLVVETQVALPDGLTTLGGAQLTDFDGDGRTDLLLSLDAGPVSEPLVLAWVRGVEAGGFSVGQAPPVIEELARTSRCTYCTYGPFPLAVGQLSEEGVADLVLESEIVIRRSPDGTPLVAARPSGRNWVEAVIGDFNGDGHSDVAAAGDPSGIDLFLGDGRGGFSPFPITTAGRARHLQAGDLDGDQIEDLAFVDDSLLTVVFGERSGGPSEQIEIPELTQIEGLATGFDLGSEDITADLLVRTGPAEAGLLVRLSGSGERALHPRFEISGLSRLVAGGAFRNPTPADVIVLTESHGDGAVSRQFSLLEGRAGAAFEEPIALATAACELESLSELACLAYVVSDMDADGRDELAIIEHARPCQDTDHPAAPPRGPIVMDLNGGQLTCQILPWPGTLRVPARLEVGDLDGDGQPDLVVGFTGLLDGEGAGWAVYWGNQSSGFGFADTPLIDELALQSLTIGAFDNDPAAELVIVANDAVRLGDLAGRVVAGSITEEAERFPTTRILSVRAGDITGDGLSDLVLTRPDGIVVTEQETCTVEKEERGRCARPRAGDGS